MVRDSVVSETTPLVVASEETPLLQANSEVLITHPELEHPNGTFESSTTAANGENGDENGDVHDDDKPLNKRQIILLCYCRVVEPIAFFSIFPYINKMISETGNVREEDVGFYSGLIESLFSLTQMTMMISWGRAADRFGRKPVLVTSLFGVAIAVSLFGMSKAIWQMIFFRCLAGVFSGTIVTVRAMITENSTPKTQARAFSIFSFSGNLGIFFGPFIGGALADPAAQYGAPFSKIQFFRSYPYALPSLVTGVIGLSAALVGAFFVEETLHVSKSDSGKPRKAPMSTWSLIKSPGVSTVLFLYNYMLLLGMAYTAVVPVFYFTSVRLGGYGLSPLLISLFIGAAGLCQAIWTLLVFPPAQHRWGTVGVLRACGIIWPVSFLINPLCNFMLRRGWVVAFWAVVPVTVIFISAASMTVVCVQLALNDISPDPTVLATLNAVALALTSGIRAVAPALFASLFATGVRNQILGGYLVWAILIPMALGSNVVIGLLPAKAEGRVQTRVVDEEEQEN